MIKEKQFYTQLSLISQFIEHYIIKNHSISISKLKINKIDEEHFLITFQKVDLESTNTVCKYKIKMIQMQKIIKIFVLLFISHLTHSTQIQKYPQKYECMDSFWFSYPNHLKSKHNNLYKLKSIKQSLSDIITSRIQKYCFHSNKNLFMPALTTQNNIYKICSFLSKKELLALESVNSYLNKIMSSNRFYIQLYETNWGKTGFQENQKNWKKTYHLKNKKLK